MTMRFVSSGTSAAFVSAALLLANAPALAARSAEPAELRQAREIYEAELQKLKDQYATDTAKAPQRQIAALTELEKHYQAAGDLRALIAVRNERKRFEANPSASDIVPVESPDKLKALQQSYVAAHNERRRVLSQSNTDLTTLYARRLAEMERELTKEGRIDDALRVMEAIERLKTGQTPSVTPPAESDAGGTPGAVLGAGFGLVGTEQLARVVRGEILKWNSMTGDISIKYNFSATNQASDWEGGTVDETHGRLVCDASAAWFAVPLKEVTRVEFEGYYQSGQGGIALRLGRSLTAEIGAGDKNSKTIVYQESEHFPITSLDRGVEPSLRYTSALEIEADAVKWSVNGRNLNVGKLISPIRYPVKVGVGDPRNRTAYDDITITGILSLDHLRAML